uniref:Uncharacterized protein n=1 Tax=Cucumis melo TaxID=3656 RepID=A0A9I9EIQ8_CUCME
MNEHHSVHCSLVVINAYDDVVYHLDSLRTSSQDDIKYITNMPQIENFRCLYFDWNCVIVDDIVENNEIMCQVYDLIRRAKGVKYNILRDR